MISAIKTTLTFTGSILCLFVFLSLVVLCGQGQVVLAQTGAGQFNYTGTPNLTYQPLVGIPGVPNAVGDFGTYLNQLYFLAISLAALLAVIKIIIAGVKYMLADVVTSKADAKSDIWGSILGLLVIISAVLILGTINPNLTNLNVLSGAPALQLQNAGAPAGVPSTGIVGSGSGAAVPNNAGGVTTAPVQQPGRSFDQLSQQAQRTAENNCAASPGYNRSYVYRVEDPEATARTGTVTYTTRVDSNTGTRQMPNTNLIGVDCNPPVAP